MSELMICLASSLGCIFSWAAAPASAPRWESTDLGQTAVFLMKSAPFPHASRENGFKAGERTYPRDPHYVDSSVALFIPRGYHAADRVDLLIYFHGHNNTIPKAFEQFKLREQVVASGQNVIMVFPEGPKDAGDSGGGKLEEPGGFKRLVDEVLDTLLAEHKIPSRQLGRVLITGHSGAYRVISCGVSVGGLEDHVTDVGLLDASYGNLDKFIDWAVRRRQGRFFSIFTDHLAYENVFLMTHMKKQGVNYELMDEQDATPADLKTHRVLFLHASRLKHDETVGWLEKWLRATDPTGAAPVPTRPAAD